MLSKLSEWLDYCVRIGEVLFAPSKENGGVWLAKRGWAVHLGRKELSIMRIQYDRIKCLAMKRDKFLS